MGCVDEQSMDLNPSAKTQPKPKRNPNHKPKPTQTLDYDPNPQPGWSVAKQTAQCPTETRLVLVSVEECPGLPKGSGAVDMLELGLVLTLGVWASVRVWVSASVRVRQ